MPEGNDPKKTVKGPVKNLVKEVLSDIVYRITKAGTKKAINELKQELREKSISRLQKKLETFSERQLDKQLEKSAERLTRKIVQEGIQRDELIRGIEQEFRQGFKEKLLTLAKIPVLKIAVVTIICIAAVTGVYAAADYLSGPGNEPEPRDTVLPEVIVRHVPERIEPGQRVTFIAEAKDNIGIRRIELLIDGKVVEASKSSPCVFDGGPYDQGSTVRYSAYAYDEAGNRAWSGEWSLQIGAVMESIDTISPKVTVGHTPQEPQADQRVTFTVEAEDNIGIERIEFLVNGQVVEESASSSLVFVGGPYGEVAVVYYSAYAYDAAGNSAWSGESFFSIPVPERYPDLVIEKVWHEWIKPGSGLCVVHFVIRNGGDGEAGSSFTNLRYGRQFWEVGVAPLAPGQTSDLEFPAIEMPIETGFEVELCADSRNAISEGDENNNCQVYTVQGIIQ